MIARRALPIFALALALGVIAGARPARADDKAKAIALFDDGIQAMRAGRYDEACKAFEASNRLLPDSGTRGSLARCYGHLGRTASAWTLWRELSDTAPTAELRADAASQARKLEPRLARYRIQLAGAIAGVQVTLDGKVVDATIDAPAPVDPGTYDAAVAAPGYLPWRGKLIAVEGQVAVLEVPALAPAPRTDPAGPIVPDPQKPVVRTSRGWRIAGIAALVAGAGGLATGGAFGLIARGHNQDAIDLCGGDIDRCDPARTNDAQLKVDDARASARIATIAFVAGGAAVVTGVVLLIAAPKREHRGVAIAPIVGGDGVGFALTGRY